MWLFLVHPHEYASRIIAFLVSLFFCHVHFMPRRCEMKNISNQIKEAHRELSSLIWCPETAEKFAMKTVWLNLTFSSSLRSWLPLLVLIPAATSFMFVLRRDYLWTWNLLSGVDLRCSMPKLLFVLCPSKFTYPVVRDVSRARPDSSSEFLINFCARNDDDEKSVSDP